jgi:chromate transporter
MIQKSTGSLREIASVFSRLGLLGFGGPIATMAMMEEEACRKRGWLTQQRYSEIYAITKVLPGPVATQMAIYLGWHRRGWLGGLLAGVLFVLPSFLIVLAVSYLYLHSGEVPGSHALFGGMQAGALAVILISTVQLGQHYRDRLDAWMIVLMSTILIWVVPRWEPVVILVFGFVGAMRSRVVAPAFFALGGIQWSLPVLVENKLAQLFWVCFKSGAFVFGSGLAIVPLLEADVVGHYHWLTHAEFMDGLAIGQITPGPVVITATFIGFQVAGWVGACVATLGMFLPAFFNILVLLPRLLTRIEGKAWLSGFSSYAVPAVIGGIAGSLVKLSWATFAGAPHLAPIFVVALVVMKRWKLPAWGVIPLAGASGWLVS